MLLLASPQQSETRLFHTHCSTSSQLQVECSRAALLVQGFLWCRRCAHALCADNGDQQWTLADLNKCPTIHLVGGKAIFQMCAYLVAGGCSSPKCKTSKDKKTATAAALAHSIKATAGALCHTDVQRLLLQFWRRHHKCDETCLCSRCASSLTSLSAVTKYRMKIACYQIDQLLSIQSG